MAYIGKSPDGTGVRARYYFTATGGETSLSGADDNAITLSFSDGAYVDVYLNGVLLVAGTDYNTTTANTISGLAALAANDIVEILVYDIFTVADTVSASAGGTFSANVAITGDLTVDTNTLYVDSTNNNVGIGTASPNNNSGRTTLTIDNASQGGAIDLEHNGTVVGKFICDGANTLGIQADGNKDMLFKTNGSSRMLINGDGDIEFGSFSYSGASAGAFIEKGATEYAIRTSTTLTSSRIHYDFYNTNGRVGSIATSGSATAYNTSSDHRLKENVADMTGAIDRVKTLAPKRFNFIADADTTVDGFLAHETQAVVPEAITGTHNEVDADGHAVMQGIDQSKLVPLLTGALQEAIAKIETLETKVAALEAAS